jgi:hypothetical protein
MATIGSAGRDSIPPPSPLGPLLMMAFWMLLGGAAGINVTQTVWRILGWQVGDIAVAIPVGATVGALCGALLGLITDPRRLVLLMAVFAGASAGAVAGRVPWGGIGELCGQVTGALLGGVAWASWRLFERRKGARTERG